MRAHFFRIIFVVSSFGLAVNSVQATPKLAVLTTLTPASTVVNSSGVTLTITGSFFNSNDAVTWNSVRLATTVVSSTQAIAQVPASYLTTTGTVAVAMQDARTGQISNSLSFTVAYPVSVSVSPNTAAMVTGGTQQFTATVSNATNTLVTWSATGGTVSSTGMYTAPATAGTYTVMATSAADPSSSALASVTVRAPTSALLSASPTSVSFGSVLLGSSVSSVIQLKNIGNSPVTLSSATMQGAGFSISGIVFPVTLAAGATQNATALFTPAASGSASGSVSFVSNATNSPLTVPLTGSGTVPVQHSVTLNWNPSGTAVSGFNVYRSTTNGGPYTRLNNTAQTTASYVDSTVRSGAVYYYVVTEISSAGMESGYSSQVTATIPTP